MRAFGAPPTLLRRTLSSDLVAEHSSLTGFESLRNEGRRRDIGFAGTGSLCS